MEPDRPRVKAARVCLQRRVAGVVAAGAVGDGIVESVLAARALPAGALGAGDGKRRMGAMFLNPEARDARAADILRDSQYGVEEVVDIGAVQQFVLQLAVFVGYAAALGGLMASQAPGTAITALPGLPSELLTLLGISTAAYLGNAAVPKAQASSK